MSWKRNRYRLLQHVRKYGVGVAASTVAVVGICIYVNKKNDFKVFASWTNSSEQLEYPKIKWDNNWDRRDPKLLVKPVKDENNNDVNDEDVKKQTPTATRHIILIRHGQYNLHAKTQKEKYLTDLGRTQSDLTGARLRDLNFPYTRLVSSMKTRAVETCDLIHKFLPDLTVERSDLLNEGFPIPPEPPGDWRPRDYLFYQHGPRIEAAFRQFIHRATPEQKTDSYEIIVCHGMVIGYFVCRALQFPPDGWLRFTSSLAHASLTWLTVRPSGRVSLRCYGDTGFMEPNQITY
ncbi:serine/threonine-protein phosphatase PGAM5, mitochondrial-like [Patella vulgata]|uniref:serine/threonine-protein phosphatase PGAM5, mitochondrial-like n=1 Tax=Patella vulgata TaxID=6465 RepID=UPI0021805AC8|nr:serine/threonine-protein phosphatase PGAM5, mitochondrial-like [Patella vulgata]